MDDWRELPLLKLNWHRDGDSWRSQPVAGRQYRIIRESFGVGPTNFLWRCQFRDGDGDWAWEGDFYRLLKEAKSYCRFVAHRHLYCETQHRS